MCELGIENNSPESIPKDFNDHDIMYNHFVLATNDLAPKTNLRLQITWYSSNLAQKVKDELYLLLVTDNDPQKTIYSIKSNETWLDEITKILELSLPFILSPLTHLINFSFSTGCFPKVWKQTEVLQLPKD